MRTIRTILVFAATALLLAACPNGKSDVRKGESKRALAFPVEVESVPSQKVEYAVHAVGSVEAFERVEVTSRVAGAIERVMFTEGENASKDKVLAEIEPQRYRLAVQAAEATLAREEASLAEAQTGFARREAASAKNPGLIRVEEVETWRTRVETARAQVAQARAALEQAKLNLRDAFVRAPVSGTIQTRTVQTGQYVQPGIVLATIIRRDPLLLRFDVPAPDSAPLRAGMPVRFTVSDDTRTFSAKISAVADSANTTSRMVAVTAVVNDPARATLKAGAFAQVVVPIQAAVEAAVVPQTAIRPTERGFLAYVVDNGIAHERILTLGMRTADGHVEVRDGLKAGEKLVVRGAEALEEGAQVSVKR